MSDKQITFQEYLSLLKQIENAKDGEPDCPIKAGLCYKVI